MNLLEPLERALVELADRTIAWLPQIVAAIAVLIVGWLVARLVSLAALKLVVRSNAQKVMRQAGWNRALEQTGVQSSPAEVIARLIFWGLFLIFLILGLESLGFELAAVPIRLFIEYLPRLLGALLLLLAGTAFASVVGGIVGASLARIRFAQHRLLASLLRGLILLATFLTAFEQLGFDVSILGQTFTNLLTLLTAALALTFALGGRESARNMLSGYYARERFTVGDLVELEEGWAELKSIGTVASELRLRESSDILVVPNRRLVETSIRRAEASQTPPETQEAGTQEAAD